MAIDEGRDYTKLVISKKRGLEDFRNEIGDAPVNEETLYGQDFYIVYLGNK